MPPESELPVGIMAAIPVWVIRTLGQEFPPVKRCDAQHTRVKNEDVKSLKEIEKKLNIDYHKAFNVSADL